MHAASPAVPRPTYVTLVAVPGSPSPTGVPITFEATLRPSDAYGRVTFSDNGHVFGILYGYRILAAYTTDALAAGSHTISVRFDPVGSISHVVRYAPTSAAIGYRVLGTAPGEAAGSATSTPGEAAPVPASGTAVAGSRKDRLPFTGAPITAVLGRALASVVLGVAAVTAGRRPRHR